MLHMLDTNICIAIIKRRPQKLLDRIERIPVGEVGISSIVAAELWYGVARSAKREENEDALADFLTYAQPLDWPAKAGPVYGRIRAELEKKGSLIGAMDMLIAAHAVFLGCTLVTDNVRELKRVSALKVENWLE